MLHRLSQLSVLTVLGAAACGGTDPTLLPYTIDSRVDGVGTLGIVAYEKDGTWVAAAETEPGVFTFTPDSEAFGYATICKRTLTSTTDNGVAVTYTVYADAAEDRQLTSACRFVAEIPDHQVTLVPADARIAVDHSEYAAQSFFQAVAGVHDLVAYTDTRALIRRGVTLPSAEPLTLDVTADGVDLEALPMTLPAGAADEVVSASYTFGTEGGTFATLSHDATQVRFIPASVSLAGDYHNVRVQATRGRATRSTTLHNHTLTAVDPKLTLRPGIESVETTWDGEPTVRWTGRPDGEQLVWLIQNIAGQGFRDWTIGMSQEWLDATDRSADGAWTQPDLSDVAGFKPEWNLAAADRASTATWVVGGANEEEAGGLRAYDYQWYEPAASDESGQLAARQRALHARMAR